MRMSVLVDGVVAGGRVPGMAEDLANYCLAPEMVDGSLTRTQVRTRLEGLGAAFLHLLREARRQGGMVIQLDRVVHHEAQGESVRDVPGGGVGAGQPPAAPAVAEGSQPVAADPALVPFDPSAALS